MAPARWRSYGANIRPSATRPCTADRMNYGTLARSAYARFLRKSGEMYRSLAGAGPFPFDFAHVTRTT